MEFTYKAYQKLLTLLEEKGYTFCNYHNYTQTSRSVILRHDIDMDIGKAVKMGELESRMGISSTYFVLVTSNFYNIFSGRSQDMLRRLAGLGHEVGLHFDEAKYDAAQDDMVQAMEQEAGLLEKCLGHEVTSVSMHRPSAATLDADYRIRDGRVVNSYGREFFHNHKYVSDSRRNWRENVLRIVESGAYDRLHVLTHPFWYDEEERSAKEELKWFCESRIDVCYGDMKDNVRDIKEFLRRDEL
ncbi:MAG: hypothetical protein K2M20_10635 [Lachnospiraceae bacterium]|nr:hypothetical protein [Lachnospiraceae bacterium]